MAKNKIKGELCAHSYTTGFLICFNYKSFNSGRKKKNLKKKKINSREGIWFFFNIYPKRKKYKCFLIALF
jgi:hypothetical protein